VVLFVFPGKLYCNCEMEHRSYGVRVAYNGQPCETVTVAVLCTQVHDTAFSLLYPEGRRGNGHRPAKTTDMTATTSESRVPRPQVELMKAWSESLVDSVQRAVLFGDVLRQRGDIFLENYARGEPPVLIFGYDVLIDGRTLDRPCNDALMKIRVPVKAKRPLMHRGRQTSAASDRSSPAGGYTIPLLAGLECLLAEGAGSEARWGGSLRDRLGP